MSDRDRGSAARIFKLFMRMKPSSCLAMLNNYLEKSNVVVTYSPQEKNNYTLHIVSRKDGYMYGRISIPVYFEGVASADKLVLAMKEQYAEFFPQVKANSSDS